MKKLFVLAILLIVSLVFLGCKQPNIPAPGQNPGQNSGQNSEQPSQPPANEEDPGQNPGNPEQPIPTPFLSVKILEIKCRNLYVTDDSNPFYAGGPTTLHSWDLEKAKGLVFENPKQLVKKLKQAGLVAEEYQVPDNITFQEVIHLSSESTISLIRTRHELKNKVSAYHKHAPIEGLKSKLENFVDVDLGPGRYGIFYYLPNTDGNISFPYTLYIVLKWRERNIENFPQY
ncbi:hypothetical protein [Treponema denticola]|uniref:hypothetical protein n=1 Tax=Treponema denticola TaxID=158 RepID=UPI0020A3AE14|nr:hypothetical protein [Treponema denticola]UTC92234.1 hypothetical protein E4N84_03580 [Treponema denticola]